MRLKRGRYNPGRRRGPANALRVYSGDETRSRVLRRRIYLNQLINPNKIAEVMNHFIYQVYICSSGYKDGLHENPV